MIVTNMIVTLKDKRIHVSGKSDKTQRVNICKYNTKIRDKNQRFWSQDSGHKGVYRGWPKWISVLSMMLRCDEPGDLSEKREKD